jgi:hypothetical protein
VRARFAANSRKTDGDWAFLSFCAEDVCEAEIIGRVCAAEDSMGSSTFGVDDSFRDSLTVEMGYEIDEVEVLEEKRPRLSSSLSLVRVGNLRRLAASSSLHTSL